MKSKLIALAMLACASAHAQIARPLQDLTALSSPATGDLVYAVDVSASNASRKLTLTTLADWLASLSQTLTNKTISGSSNTLTVLAGSQLSGQTPLANGGTGANLTDPGADRILFWDESGNIVTWLTLGTNLSITGTTINATGGGGSGTVTSVDIDASALGLSSDGPITTSGTIALTGVVDLDSGGTGATLSAPSVDSYMIWESDNSAVEWLTMPGSTRLSAAITALTPTAYWRLNETSGNFQDSGAGNYDAVLTGSVTRAVSALLPDAGARYANFTAATGAYGATSSLLGVSTPISGSWSICAIVRPIQSTGTAGRYLFGIIGGSETEANNDQAILYLESDQLKVFWEYSTGTNVTILGPGGLSSHQTMHACAIKVSASTRVDFYVNGALSAQPTYANEPTGGSSATAVVMGHTGSATSVIGGEVFFLNGTALTQTQVESLAIAAGMMGR